MKRTLCLSVFALLVSIITYAQTFSLKGEVTDKNRQAISYASIALLKPDSTTLAGGTISDDNGQFTLADVKPGNYVISVSFMGYKSHKEPIKVASSQTLSFTLEEDAVTLGEVTVEANRSNAVKQSAAGQTFMLSASSAKKKDVLQALQEIPALNIDLSTRQITMNNGGQPLILVNGMRREGGIAAINPEDILSVDVVQTASAEFMREGYTSVINIKTKKIDQKYTSFNGGIHTHPAIRFGIADASLEVGNSNSSFYVTAQSFAFLNNKSDMLERTVTANNRRELNYRRNSHYNDTYVAMGGDRLWSDADYSSFSVTFDYIPQSSEANGTDELADLRTNTVTPYTHWRELNDKSYAGSANLYHKHTFGNSSVLDFLVQLNLSKNINQVNQIEESETDRDDYHYNYHNSRFGLSFTPSYKLNVAGFDTKIGLNTYFQSNQIKQHDVMSSAFKHKEWDEYLYLDVNRNWGAFSMAVSVGVDAVYRSIDAYSDHYYNFRPVVNLGYRFNGSHSLLFSYNMQSVAPGILQLNPYNTSSDTLTVSTGNPSLKPYRIQRFRLAYTLTKGNFYVEPEVNFRRIDDAIVNAGENRNGYYVKSLANQGKSTLLTAGANVRYTISKVGYVGLSIYYNHFEYPSVTQKNDYWSGRVYGGLNWKNFGLNFTYGLPERTYDMYTRSYSSPESEARLSYAVSKNWDVSLGMRFIGWKKHVERWTDMPDYTNYYDNRFTNRGNLVMLGFRYKFQNRSKANREQKRLQNTDKGFRVIAE